MSRTSRPSSRRPAAATPAIAACAGAGVEHAVHELGHGDTERFGEEAAAKLAERGVAPERVLKTLVVELAGRRSGLAVAVVPVPSRLDLKACARAFGAHRATMADPAKAQRSSGYVVGGISPLGQRRALPTVVDASARGHETVFVSAGRRGLDLELSPADLAALTGAEFAEVAG
ncbi:aminoacyl-tRNA deacylase [Corynebacterium sp. 335C]